RLEQGTCRAFGEGCGKNAEQAPNVVINLVDSPLSISEVTQYLQRNPVGKANSVILIKGGKVVVLGG
ncbi:hypothetical protein, partial [Ralstonia solanacearum]|uniref:hypothetical protein n=1 Tax=Ralstonia solanacearum TaxID=305 RepID=UPI0018AFEA13